MVTVKRDGWLCLNRKALEQIVLTTETGTRVIIEVGKVGEKNVQLLFKAPQNISINRLEVQDVIDAANQQKVTTIKSQDQPQEGGQPGSAVGGSERQRS